MTDDEALDRLATLAGIHPSYRDMTGVTQTVTVETQRALLAANGLAAQTGAEARESLAMMQADAAERLLPQDLVVTADAPYERVLAAGAQWAVTDETGQSLIAEGRSAGRLMLPPLTVGVYVLTVDARGGQQTATVLAAPPRAPSVADLAGTERHWGVVAALYGLQSKRNAGVGDYRDLADLAVLLGKEGAGFLGINPIHAPGWANDQAISPYSPTHRGFLNPMHIAGDALTPPARQVSAAEGFLDYAAHRELLRPALKAAFEHFETTGSASERGAFEAFCAAGGQALTDFATFEALSETYGPDARDWPTDAQNRAAASSATSPRAERFHLWLQWLADQQVSQASMAARAQGLSLGLYLDLAVGARLGGAEAWANAEALATDVSIGAPPDALSPAGQNWQLCAYAPRKLTRTRYAALRHILRQSMRHAGLLRIDHALGLNRSFWLPADGTPGGYITQPFEALLALVRIEATLSGTVIVGEDLGLVPKGFREEITASGLYGYTVRQFEREESGRFRAVSDLRPQTLACFGTHDTPTLRGFWEGRDIGWWQRLGWISETEAQTARTRRAEERCDLIGAPAVDQADKTPFETVREQVHAELAAGPTALVAVQLDDVLGEAEAQNLPGTIDQHPNWRRAAPVPLEDLPGIPALQETGRLMHTHGRGHHQTEKRTPHED